MAKGGKAAGAAGGFLKKQLGDLIRPAKKRAAGSGDEAARAAKKSDAISDAMDTNQRQVREQARQEAWDRARKARDDEHDRLVRDAKSGGASNAVAKRRLGNKQVVTGASDTDGFSAAGTNFPAQGGWGCAEKNALDNLNAQRRAAGYPELGPRDVYFSEARRIKVNGSYDEKDICKAWCQNETGPWQYPPNTRPQEGGAWTQ